MIEQISEPMKVPEAANILARDPLTGMCSRAGFYDLATIEVEKAKERNETLGVVYLFLKGSPIMGQPGEDELLCSIAKTIKKSVRGQSDLICKLRQDEFLILLPDTSPDATFSVLHRLKETLGAQLDHVDSPIVLSVGAVTYLTAPDSVDSLMTAIERIIHSSRASCAEKAATLQNV